VLLPATMKFLGERNWYLPSWLGWLPRVRGEHAARPSAPRVEPELAPQPARG
jgi:RND superfamily putative drug exporter